MKEKDLWIPYVITLLVVLFVAGLILGYTDLGEYIISKILK